MTIQTTLTINQGETYSFAVQWVGANLAGATAKMQIKAALGSSGTALATFTSTPAVGISLSTDTVTVTVSAATSAAWAFTSAYTDLLLTLADGTTKRLLQGPVTVSPQVTT